MPSYKFPSRVLADDDSAFEVELAGAHQSRFRPTCLCHSPAPEMYIARLGDKYFIKRMPGTGLTHHHSCEHFDPPPSLSGLGDVMGRAIQQKDDCHTVLKLDFSLTKVGRSSPAQASESKSDIVKAETNKLTLLGLLHYLWHEAELNKWNPRFAGRRSWPMLQARLIDAASAKETKKAALVERLYVPEPYYRERAQEIDGRRMPMAKSWKAWRRRRVWLPGYGIRKTGNGLKCRTRHNLDNQDDEKRAGFPALFLCVGGLSESG